MPGGIQQRLCVRIPYTEFVLVNRQLRARGIDLSEGGLYLHTGRSFPDGSLVEVTFSVAHMPYTVTARVQFHREGVGMGLQFVSLPHEVLIAIRKHIDAYVQSHGAETCALEKKTVVLLSTNELGIKMYRSELVLAGFSVIEAREVKQALSVLEEQLEFKALLFVGNVELKEGYAILNAVIAKAKEADVPVVVISPLTDVGTPGRVIDLGAQGFLNNSSASPKKVAAMVLNL